MSNPISNIVGASGGAGGSSSSVVINHNNLVGHISPAELKADDVVIANGSSVESALNGYQKDIVSIGLSVAALTEHLVDKGIIDKYEFMSIVNKYREGLQIKKCDLFDILNDLFNTVEESMSKSEKILYRLEIEGNKHE